MEKELFTITAVESNLSEVIAAIIRLIEEKSIRIFWFSGDLGAGKTTLIRSLVRELGYSGIVGSPTYGLVNTYDLENTCDLENTVDLEINATHLNKSTNLDSPNNNNNNNNNQLDLGFSDINRVNPFKHKRVHHSDWYRIESIDELYDSGIEEELHEGNDIWLIEWAEMGIAVLESLSVIKIEIEASAPTSPRVYRFVMV
jgi:tRNA A37 threonylcarbamoyladenosine biosynthesis protein TsaE